jgi:hypothetical protein
MADLHLHHGLLGGVLMRGRDRKKKGWATIAPIFTLEMTFFENRQFSKDKDYVMVPGAWEIREKQSKGQIRTLEYYSRTPIIFAYISAYNEIVRR